MKRKSIFVVSILMLLSQACTQKQDGESKNIEQSSNKETMEQISAKDFTTFKVSFKEYLK